MVLSSTSVPFFISYYHPIKRRFYKDIIQSLSDLNAPCLTAYFQRFSDDEQDGLTIILKDGRKVQRCLGLNFSSASGHFDFKRVDEEGTPILEYQKKTVLVYAEYFARYFNEHEKTMREELNIFRQDIYLNHNVFRELHFILNAIARDLIHSRNKLIQTKEKVRTEMPRTYQQAQKFSSFKTVSDPVNKKEILESLTLDVPPDGLGVKWSYAPGAHTFWVKVLKKEDCEILINNRAKINRDPWWPKTDVPFDRLFTFKRLQSGAGYCLFVSYENIQNYYIQFGSLKPIERKASKNSL